MMLRRGKVSYLFDKYSDSWRINAILFCKNMDKPESELGEVLNSWISNNIGATPEQRAKYISSTNFTSPFFIISTFSIATYNVQRRLLCSYRLCL